MVTNANIIEAPKTETAEELKTREAKEFKHNLTTVTDAVANPDTADTIAPILDTKFLN